MNRFWKMKLPAFLLAMVMVIGMVPAASAARADISYDVDAGKYIAIDDSDFSDYFDDETTSRTESLKYLEFTRADDFDDYGYFYAYDKDRDRVRVDYDDLLDGTFYVDKDDVDSRDEYELSGLRFYADKDAESETLSFTFKCYGDERSSYTGYLEISIDGGSSSGSSRGDIVLEVDADDEETVSAKSFKSFFDKKSNETFSYMYFDKNKIPSKLDRYGYFYSRNKNDKETSIDAEDLADAEFYYDSDDVTSTDKYTLDDLTFVADEDAGGETVSLPFYVVGNKDDEIKGTLVIKIGKSSGSSSKKGDITYTAEPSKEVEFDEDDFYDFLDDNYSKELKYVEFTDASGLKSSTGYVYYRYDTRSEVEFDDDLEDYYFYYDKESNVPSNADEDEIYPLDDLSFVASKSFTGSVTLKFRAYYSTTTSSSYKEGTVVIDSGKSGTSTSGKGDINIKLKPGTEAEFDPDDFNDVFQKEYKSSDFEYLIFTDSQNLVSYNGDVYYNYGRSSAKKFTASSLEDAKFYYNEKDVRGSDKNDYALEDISFVAASTFLTTVTLEFRAYYSSSKYVDGTVVITPDGVSTNNISSYVGNIRYSTTGTNVQINANDIARFFSKNCPGFTLQYVTLGGVPATGSLYYNYYGTSKFGAGQGRMQLTSYNCSSYILYANPTAANQYALTELTYVPSGRNYCAAIPFTAYGTGGRSVSGTILISVTNAVVYEVYGVTPKNTPVTFPASAIYERVLSATGSALHSIQLLSVPNYAVGTVYAGTAAANTYTRYTYAGGTNSMNQLRFVPNSTYTGSVEIPYVALNSNGTAIASGVFSLGVVSARKNFSDMATSTWCYKYVVELSDAKVIDGYTDGTFKPNNTITYGAALKLIMLAAGYPEQAPTTKNSPFSGYLAKARAEGIITKSDVNLTKPITRLQVAQLAAGAMKLDTNSQSSVKPFTDTNDASVQALNAAGIVEGYFSNGTSTFKPNNTLTRGQVSAIVWRMRNYNK